MGFGITTKSDVENIISSGADGAIIGSKFVSLVDDLGKAREYIIEVKG
ncbi:tryptophan synthase subunit alpha [Helcococcus kunzii]